MKDRLEKAFESINKLGSGFNVFINKQYFTLKVLDKLNETDAAETLEEIINKEFPSDLDSLWSPHAEKVGSTSDE